MINEIRPACFKREDYSYLPNILNRYNKLKAKHAEDGEEIQTNRIYIAPPNDHLLISNRTIRLWHGPREHGFRPAIDQFTSAPES